jgi:hypothetical protein
LWIINDEGNISWGKPLGTYPHSEDGTQGKTLDSLGHMARSTRRPKAVTTIYLRELDLYGEDNTSIQPPELDPIDDLCINIIKTNENYMMAILIHN